MKSRIKNQRKPKSKTKNQRKPKSKTKNQRKPKSKSKIKHNNNRLKPPLNNRKKNKNYV